MNDKNTISDELLTKFLCGKTTPEETELVMAYMAESDENVEDLKNICAAIEIQKDKTASQPTHTRRNRIFKRAIWTITSVAASVLIIVACYIAFTTNTANNNDPVIAEVNDTILHPITNIEIGGCDSTNNSKKDKVNEEMAKHPVPILQPNREKNYAGSTEKEGYCNMLAPKKSTYSVPLSQAYFDFSWSTDAPHTKVELYDSNHKLIHKEESDDDYIRFKTAEYQTYNLIYWKVTALFENGNTTENKGTIRFEKE